MLLSTGNLLILITTVLGICATVSGQLHENDHQHEHQHEHRHVHPHGIRSMDIKRTLSDDQEERPSDSGSSPSITARSLFKRDLVVSAIRCQMVYVN